MRKLKFRLFINFATQFISVGILMVVVIFLTLLVVVYHFVEKESEHNYYQVLLEDISTDTDSLVQLEMSDGWKDNIQKEDIWVQIVNEEGEVVDSGNVPNDIPKSYRLNDLEKMKKTKELNGYTLYFYLETFYKEPYLFILGHKDEANRVMNELIDKYHVNGLTKEEDRKDIEQLLANVHGSLEVYQDHQLLVKIGENYDKKEKPLDAFLREAAPNMFSTKRLTYENSEANTLWVLHTPNDKKKQIQLDSYREFILTLAITGVVILLITIAISVWNGFRYGNPLFIFTNLLSRMGNEQYEEVLTIKEKKLFYRKSGKIKRRYRLYEEVFQAFYTMAEKLAASRKEREQLEKSRQEWMSGISHDLRTPISTMQGYGNLLESGQYEWTKEELEEIGHTIREKSDYMVNLIEDFSLSFQLKNDSINICFEVVEINQFMKEILDKFTRDRMLSTYPCILQTVDEPVFIQMNKRLFERMIDNLLYNAMKHNPPGTKTVVTLSTDGMELKIRIEDNGVGMDEETLSHLFTRYYRGTNTEEESDGTGLGMSIAKQIVDLHKGMIFVESKPNKGTVVTILLLINKKE